MRQSTGKHRAAARGRASPAAVLALDLLLAGVFLCVFALFHHVIPFRSAADAEPVAVIRPTPAPVPAETPESAAEPESAAAGETPEETPDLRSPWQIRFAEHFTDEPVITDRSYSDRELSVEISTVHQVINGYDQVWYVADIYVARVEQLRTWAGEGSFTRLVQTPMEELAREVGAVLAVNGDYCNAQAALGFYVRNGEVYSTDPTGCDICVLYCDGTMETYGPLDYRVQDVLDREPWQVWKFGPRLLDAEGEIPERFNTTEFVYGCNPRCGIGYYEPGHYCFVVADGRSEDWSLGLSIPQYAQVFRDLGCAAAYNLDGGASATMAFRGTLYNRQSREREVGDILFVRGEGEVSE